MNQEDKTELAPSFYRQPKVVDKHGDTLQRYPFCKRISEMVLSYSSSDSLTIGIYGEWGAGKTTVLDLIEKDLRDSNKVITCNFNPWRYNSVEEMQKAFWGTLRQVVDKTPSSRESIGTLLTEFGNVVSGIPYINIKALGESIKPTHEKLKENLDIAMRQLKTHIVMCIDDIDRLDFNKMSAIMSLIKLNADFPNIIYLSAFDKKIVNGVINKSYKDASPNSDFLEKIIQVPIILPKIMPYDLMQFIDKGLNKIVDNIGGNIVGKESSYKINLYLDKLVLHDETTLRKSLMYLQSLSILAPMLVKEVNMIDLMLLELIKAYYPTAYQFISKNKAIMLGDKSKKGKGADISKSETYTNKLLEGIKDSSTKKNLLELICYLFPQAFIRAANNTVHRNTLKEKRICQSIYFDKFFTYTNTNGDLLDVEMVDFYNNLSRKSTDELVAQYKEAFNKDINESQRSRLFNDIDNLSKFQCINLLKFLSAILHDMSQRSMLFFFSMYYKYERFIVDLSLTQKLTSEEIVDIVLQQKKNDTRIKILRRYIHWNNKDNNDGEGKRVSDTLLKEIILGYYTDKRTSSDSSWYISPEFNSNEIVSKIIEYRPELKVGIVEDLKSHPKNTFMILQKCLGRSIFPDGTEKTNCLEADRISEIEYYMDLETFKELVEIAYPDKVKDAPQFTEQPDGIREIIDVIPQFIHLYNESKS